MYAGEFQSTQPKRAATQSRLPSSGFHGNFNPRSPRGLRLITKFLPGSPKIFQSTQPKRAATNRRIVKCVVKSYFNPRSPRGLRRRIQGGIAAIVIISIHAAQEGCDVFATLARQAYWISIHAAQEGCD